MSSPEMHRHDFFECFLILEGEGRQMTPGGSETLSPYHLYFLHPDHAHCIDGGTNLVFLNIAFERSVFTDQLSVANFDASYWRPKTPIQHLRLDSRRTSEMVRAAADVAGDPSRRNAAWLLLSIARIVSRTATPPSTPMPEWFAEGLAHAGEAEILAKGVEGVTHLMGRSRKQVGRCFRQYLGVTPTEWLTRERVQRACLLLSTTRLSVLEIALDCGFESPSHFHKCFREQTGTTPLQHRKALSRVQT